MMRKKTMEKPHWLKVKAPGGKKYLKIKDMAEQLQLATVCQEARCPNLAECWSGGTATFMLMGDVCTRGCRFCAVQTGNPKGRLNSEEPERVGAAISQMGLEYVVLTSVDRDDLPDGGAEHFARTVETLRKYNPDIIIEVLTPDFKCNRHSIARLTSARPDVFAQNVETVEWLTDQVRDPRAGYWQTLNVLSIVKELSPDRYTKTSLMLGLGESFKDITKTLEDLRSINCDIVTFGQYLQPTKRHLKVEKFYSPTEFKRWKKTAEEMGFLYVASGPLVRSSYRAGEFFMKGVIEKQRRHLAVTTGGL